MLHLTFVGVLLNTVFPTHCDVPAWHHLYQVRTTLSQEAIVSSNSPRYEVVPGSLGMFSDVAQEVENRMRRIANGPFTVVFDFGGIAAKYYSIIEDITSEPGAASTNRVKTEPLQEHGLSADGEFLSTQINAKPMLAMRSMTYTPASAADASPSDILADASSDDGVIKGILPSTPSGFESNNSPIAAVTMESTSAVGDLPPTANPVAISEGSPLSLLSTSTTIQPPQDLSSGSESLLNANARGVNAVKAVEPSGKTFAVLSNSSHQVSIAEKSTNETMYFTTVNNSSVNAADAHALYISLKPVTTELSLVIKSGGFNCVHLKATKIDLNIYVVDNIVFGEGQICGLDNMRPGNNVTITKHDENIIEVTVPLILKDLTVNIKSVDVNNYFFAILTNQPIEASVKVISCNGIFSFKNGTFELVSIRIEWGDITGIHIKLEGAMEDRGAMSGVVDYLAGALSGVIKSFISPILDEIERQITKNILGS